MVENKGFLGYDVPTVCVKCGGAMEYMGVGEYKCVKCGYLAYDDYGKVRNYIEAHPGATMDDVFRATGVAKNKIRQLLIEERIEVAPNSVVFLNCNLCGAQIRSGLYCKKCAAKIKKQEETVTHRSKSMSGYANSKGKLTEGERRFMPGRRES